VEDIDTNVSNRTRIAAFILWFIVGVAYGFGVAAVLSFGALLLAVALVGTGLLVWRRATRVGWPTVICGPAITLLYIAYLNRSGPGTVCTTAASGQSCVDRYSPWPFVAAAAILIAAGVVLAVGLTRRSSATRHGLSSAGHSS
jgi:hypothetical protein